MILHIFCLELPFTEGELVIERSITARYPWLAFRNNISHHFSLEYCAATWQMEDPHRESSPPVVKICGGMFLFRLSDRVQTSRIKKSKFDFNTHQK
jgi:hypothetical protein